MSERTLLRHQVFMQMADSVALLGTCSRLRVGAVIVREGRVVSTGYNGAAAGLPHCNHLEADEGCKRAIHAEANAVAFAARFGGVGTDGATLYVTHSPCLSCAQVIVNAGIKLVVYREEYRIKDGLELLDDAGVSLARISA